MSGSDLRLPGFANAHSHAFQRDLRGQVQHRIPGVDDSFWTWRERMYTLALRHDLESLADVAFRCYVECLEAGYTAVGEFHYLHHRPDGSPWPDPIAAARVHMLAAERAGIRLTLLWCAYANGGIDQPLSDRQRRFRTCDVSDAERSLDALLGAADGRPLLKVGLALHSVRAVPRAWMGPLTSLARQRGLPIHAHLSEQPREVAEAKAAWGLSPIGVMAAEGALGPDFTAIHATWLDEQDIDTLAAQEVTVCLCPTTEGDLGDGFPPTAALHDAGIPLCIGSDSHAIIDPFSELRFAEYQARAQTQRRCVLVDQQGQPQHTLQQLGHTNGYRSLGLTANTSDYIVLKSNDSLFRGISGAAARQSTALLGGHRGLVQDVFVAGRPVVQHGRWIDHDE